MSYQECGIQRIALPGRRTKCNAPHSTDATSSWFEEVCVHIVGIRVPRNSTSSGAHRSRGALHRWGEAGMTVDPADAHELEMHQSSIYGRVLPQLRAGPMGGSPGVRGAWWHCGR